MEIDNWTTSDRRSQSDHTMSYSSSGQNQPPSIGNVRQIVVSEPSGGSQMYSDGQPPSVNDVRRPEASQSQSEASCTRYEGLDEHEVQQQVIMSESTDWVYNRGAAAGTSNEITAYCSGYDERTQDLVSRFGSQVSQPVTEVGPEAMEIDTRSTSWPYVFPNSDVTVLEGHTSSVKACAWSPTSSLLASGSFDSTARIWTIGDGPRSSKIQKDPLDVVVLNHSNYVQKLNWNDEGTLLATGSFDGHVRIWCKDGELVSTLTKHKGRIYSLKWNKKGDYLLSGSKDKTTVVWDIKTGKQKQKFEFHTAPVHDVDWRNNVSFATSSSDNMIYVCKVGDNQPVKKFVGHKREVKAINWDPTGRFLASCSDDSTVKIWSLKQDDCVHDLKEHTKKVYTIRWSPTGPGTNNPNQPLVLASASLDSTIKLWDVEAGTLLHSLVAHEHPVFSIAFSPNGKYLASGSLDKCMHIWSVKEAKVVKTYIGSDWILDVCWNNKGDKIGACFHNDVVCVFDFRM